MVAPALAQPAVATASTVYVERMRSDAVRRLEPAHNLSRRDRVITVVNWRRLAGGDSFVITNPLPTAVAYEASARDEQEVSADGGRTWGRVGTLRTAGRYATPEDITHVRWRISARAPRSGQIAYSVIVR